MKQRSFLIGIFLLLGVNIALAKTPSENPITSKQQPPIFLSINHSESLSGLNFIGINEALLTDIIPHYPYPALIVSPYLEIIGQHWYGDPIPTASDGIFHEGTAIFFDEMRFSSLGIINEWISSFIFARKVTGSKPELISAFINVGNLSLSPWYVTVGNLYLPFGKMSAPSWSDPVTKSAFRPKSVNQIAIGYRNDLIGSTFSVFEPYGASEKTLNFVYRLMLTGNLKSLDYEIGTSYLNDGQHLRSSFSNALSNTANPFRIPLIDAYLQLNWHDFSFLTEQVQTLHPWIDATNGQSQGKASAWSILGTYHPTIKNIPVQVGAVYSKTRHMRGIPLGFTGDAGLIDTGLEEGVNNSWIFFGDFQPLPFLTLGLEYNRLQTYTHKKTHTITLYCDWSF